MLLEINRRLFSRSDRVKSVDFHPTEPWLVTGLYNGSVNIYNHQTGAIVKTFEVSQVPVRCVRFIPRKNWFVTGSDDFQLRVFNYNTHDKVVAFEAHPDYIRCLAVHPTLPLVFTGSDDMTIKSWDWDKSWKCANASPRQSLTNPQVFQGHTHYIMNIAINPKDTNTFATACLDRTVKVWSISNPTPNFSFDAHEKGGVNFVEYYYGNDKPYMITTGDDKTIKIWDYLSKSCIQTLEGHTSNVSFAVYHPTLPVIVSGSEDGTVKIWHANTYRLENTLNYALERAWCVTLHRETNEVAVGFDDGVVVLKLGRDEPSYSMDPSGKLVYTRGSEVLTSTLQTAVEDATPEGARIPLPPRELGSTEIYANAIIHSPNGRFVTVVGDGEYIIYTALAWRNKAFGPGNSFAWGDDSNTYAVQEGKLKIKVYRNFREKKDGAPKGVGAFGIDGVHGGPLLGARGGGFVVFWDWETGEIARRVDVEATNIYWSGTGTLVAIVSEDSFYVIRFDREAYNTALASGMEIGDEGVEAAFEIVAEVSESVKTARWAGDCFIYTNSANRLNYLVGTQTNTITHFDTPMYLLGYIPAHNKIYLVDKDVSVYAYGLSLAVVEYQTAVLREDMEAASELLAEIPAKHKNSVARFLEAQDLKQLALEISTDPDHRFDLALSLDALDIALSIAEQTPAPENEVKWKAVGDRALSSWKFSTAKRAYEHAGDVGALFLLGLAMGDVNAVKDVGRLAKGKGLNNIAFAASWQTGDARSAVDLLVDTERASEAALLARTYAPSRVGKAVNAWRGELEKKGRAKVGALIADPLRGDECELFEEGWEATLHREENTVGRETNGVHIDTGVDLKAM